MNGDANLSDRVAALEKAAAGAKPGGRIFWRLGGLLLVVLVSWNFWLINQSRTARQQASLEHRFWVIGHGVFSAKERTEAFLELVVSGNKEWRGAHLEGLSLEGASLANAELEGADFNGSNLARGSLAGAHLAKARLLQADLTEADLSGADLGSGELFRAVLRRAQFRRANLRGANLEQVEGQNSSLVAAHLSEAYLLMANLTEANLTAADLAGANLEAAILKGANLSLAQLAGAKLKDTDFADSNWWRARGLTSDQIVRLIKNFAPGEKASAALRDDYQAWLKTIQAGR